RRFLQLVAPARHHHCRGALDRAQAVARQHRDSSLGAQRSWLDRADLEIVPGHAQLRTAQAEDLHRQGELERTEPVVGEDRNRSLRGAHWQTIYEGWQNCQRRASDRADTVALQRSPKQCRRSLRALRSPRSPRPLPPTPCIISAACSSSRPTAGTSTPRWRTADSSCSTSAAPSISAAAPSVARSTCPTAA